MQSNLNKWFDLKELNIPKYFYWKWGNNAIWTHDEYEGNFKVEIKAPTFYEMVIEDKEQVYMKFLLDL